MSPDRPRCGLWPRADRQAHSPACVEALRESGIAPFQASDSRSSSVAASNHSASASAIRRSSWARRLSAHTGAAFAREIAPHSRIGLPMKLYQYYRSSAAYRVRIALSFKGIPWETALIDLRAPVSAQHTPEFRAVNPEGLIPVVVEGDTTIAQSLAIIE